MSNQSALNFNITGFFNSLITLSYPHELSEKVDGDLFDRIINLNYNSYNETIYIETTSHYYVLEYLKGVVLKVTEFDKPDNSGVAE